MHLSESQKKHLRGLGHSLKPVVTVGDAGLTGAVLHEFENTIRRHELIKVKIRAGDRQARNEVIDSLVQHGEAELINRVGNVALVFRRNQDEPKIFLSGQ